MHYSVNLCHSSYVRFSAICADIVRNAMKPQFKPVAARGPTIPLRVTRWENGKPVNSECTTVISIWIN